METLSSATSVRDIVAQEPDASGLLPYLEDNMSLPPPADVAERIWGLLIQDIMPHSARARQQQLGVNYGGLPYAGFQLMRVVAETCQIHDFCLADIRRASVTRWGDQMRQVDAFLASRMNSLQEYNLHFAEIRKLELEELSLLNQRSEVMRKAAPLLGQRGTLQQTRARTLSAIAQLEQKTDQLSGETANLESEHRTISESIDKIRSSLGTANADLTQVRRHMSELRPVLARGANTLEDDLLAVEQRVEVVLRNLTEIHTRGEAYGFALDALKAIKENLQRLLALKEQSQAIQEEEQSLKAHVAPMQLRLDQLANEHESVLATNHGIKTQNEDLQSGTREARLRVEELTNRLKQAAAQLDALETRDKSVLEQLEKELVAETRQLQELDALVRSREQWLDDFRTAEAASTRMENELAILRGWLLSQAT